MHQALIAETKEAMEQRERAEKAEARHAEAVALLRRCSEAIPRRYYTVGELFANSSTSPQLPDEIDAHLAACDGKGVGG